MAAHESMGKDDKHRHQGGGSPRWAMELGQTGGEMAGGFRRAGTTLEEGLTGD